MTATSTERRDDGIIVAVAGASRWGKTGWVKRELRAAERLLVWDIRGEYRNPDEFGWPGAQTIRTIPELARALKNSRTGRARLAYWGAAGTPAEFAEFCRLAYVWTQLWPSCTVVEELADVTTPAKAPPAWGELIRKGAYYGHHLYGITQRPAECDKTLWGNASLIHCTGFPLVRDREYMARQLGCDPARIEALKPLHYLERWAGATAITEGRLA